MEMVSVIYRPEFVIVMINIKEMIVQVFLNLKKKFFNQNL